MTFASGIGSGGKVELCLGPYTTTDDTPITVQWATLNADGACIIVRSRVWGVTDDATEGFFRLSEGHIARAAGTTFVHRTAFVGPGGYTNGPTPAGGQPAGWAGEDWEIAGDDVFLGLTGVVATTIEWRALYEFFLVGDVDIVI